MKFKFIQQDDPEYSQERMLRWEVLRKPLGLPPGSEFTNEDSNSLHLVALDRKKVVGCVLFHPESATKGELYQMALSEEFQGKGFGRQLIASIEHALIKRGIKEVYLLAKQESVGFYLRMGYHPEGQLIERKGILHQTMTKTLTPIAAASST